MSGALKSGEWQVEDSSKSSMPVTCHFEYNFVGEFGITGSDIKIKHRNSPVQPAIKQCGFILFMTIELPRVCSPAKPHGNAALVT